MRHYWTPGSILNERTYFSRAEIETMANDELRLADCRPKQPEPIALEKYLHRRHGLEALITELDPGLMGSADFTNPRQPVISIATEVFNGPVPRYRSTLAHEIGHLVLHASLFLDAQFLRALEHLRRRSLHRGFECATTDIDEAPRERVNKADPLFHLEYQANLFMVAVLLPRPLVRTCVASWTRATSLRGGERETILIEAHRQEAIQSVAKTFAVSRTMATFRLAELYGAPTAVKTQPTAEFLFNFSASTDSPPQAWAGTDGSWQGSNKEVLWKHP
jgi:Zn-dependent peptidase ImmA (M78 family)